MENKTKNEIIKQLSFLKKVYEKVITDRNANVIGIRHAKKELKIVVKLIIILENQ